MRIILTTLLLFGLTASSYSDDSAALNERILELLKKYSPDGARIVQMEMDIENEMNPVNPSENLVFTPFTEKNIVASLPVVVHEAHHGLSRYGQDIVYPYSGRGYIGFENKYFYLKEDDFALVKVTETFPSRELVSLFSDTLQRRFLFFPYVVGESEIHSTQQSGIFGLLSEFNAYYISAKTVADCYPYYESRGADADWSRFLIDITFDLYACHEFKYFILTYLLYAQENHPKIYHQLMNHKPFLYTFFEIDRLIDELFAYYMEGREHVFALLETFGMKAWADDGFLYIEKNGRTKDYQHLIDAADELDQWMNEGDYKAQLDVMKAAIAGWDRNVFWSDLDAMTIRLPERAQPVRDGWEPFKDLQVVVDDPVSDVEFPFIDISRAGFALNPDGSMWIHMQMSDIPEKLACDQPGVRESEFEYMWSMVFTVPGDSVTYYKIDLYEYLAEGPYITDITNECVAGVYTDRLIEDLEIERRQVGNTLILHIGPNKYFQAQRENVRIYFETLYNNGKVKTQDFLPDYEMKNTMLLDPPVY